MNKQRRNVFSIIAGALGFGVAAKAATIDEEFPASELFKLLYQRLERVEGDAERKEVSLAGCSVAALGGTKEENVAKPTDWAWHPAYQDVLDLRRKFDAALRIIRERAYEGSVSVLYPCGCSASASTVNVLLNCPDHDPDGRQASRCSIARGCKPAVYRKHPWMEPHSDFESRESVRS
jgi:hypothetical protein